MRLTVGTHEIEVEVVGEGRPILFVHGLAADRRLMAAAFEPLPDGWRRIYIDLPGHGGSRGDPVHASADELVDVIWTVTRELCGDTAPALQSFARPVGIVCGRDDHWVGFEDALRLARACREAHYAVLPRCGHLLPFEQPAAFRQHFDAWLVRL
jgi:pimeloyl-ACP methyl ester carboxylesterase